MGMERVGTDGAGEYGWSGWVRMERVGTDEAGGYG